MPKAKKSTSANAPTAPSAAALIAKAARGAFAPEPDAKAMAELRTVLAHNDVAAPRRKVSAEAALEMLHGHGWQGSRPALDSVCRRLLGRRSYGTP